MGPAFEWTWKILQWPVVFGLVAFAIAMIYYYAPDAEQEWIWITPGSILATLLWLLISLGFKFYVVHFTSYNATYGAIGGVIVLMLWFYVSALAVLIGAELNAEIEHASPYGKEPGEKVPGEKRRSAPWPSVPGKKQAAGALRPAIATANCDIDDDLCIRSPRGRSPRFSDSIIGGLVLAEIAAIAYAKLKARFDLGRRRLASRSRGAHPSETRQVQP